MYHIDSKMMGRGAGWQYPHMLAKHNAGRLGVAPATVIVVGQVSGLGRDPSVWAATAQPGFAALFAAYAAAGRHVQAAAVGPPPTRLVLPVGPPL